MERRRPGWGESKVTERGRGRTGGLCRSRREGEAAFARFLSAVALLGFAGSSRRGGCPFEDMAGLAREGEDGEQSRRGLETRECLLHWRPLKRAILPNRHQGWLAG